MIKFLVVNFDILPRYSGRDATGIRERQQLVRCRILSLESHCDFVVIRRIQPSLVLNDSLLRRKATHIRFE